MMKSTILRLFLLTFLTASGLFAQVFTLSGTVRDAATKETLPAANIRVEGTSRGTIANAVGVYNLTLEKGKYTIVYSFIGYQSDTLHLDLDHPIAFNPNLQPVSIQMPEVVVTSEDPGMAIMRKVIENKKRWVESLKTYEFEAFTRFVLRRDTAIAMITESYTTGYWRKGDTLREVVKQKRHTENIPGIGNIAVGGSVINFYDDDIRFVGFEFVGPTSPEAFDYYDFKLEKTRVRDDRPVYKIRVTPKSRLVPLFRGTLDVAGDSYALAGIDVVPNEAFTMPFLSEMELHYTQQFSLYEEKYWMPMDVRLHGWIKIGLAGFSFPRIAVEQSSVLYDYRINRSLADSIFTKPKVLELATAKAFDSTFWSQHDVLPLTKEEKTAYKTLDSTQTLDKQFEPSGPLSGLSSPFFESLGYFDVRYNRVEGLFLGLRYSRDSVISRLTLSGSAGYGFSDKKPKFSFGGTWFLDSTRHVRIGAEAYRTIDNVPDEGYFPSFAILFGALLTKVDYRDYYFTDGWRAYVEVKPKRRIALQLEYRSERQLSAMKTTDYSLFERRKVFRTNPAIDEGMMRSISVSARYGDEAVPLGLATRNAAELEIEHSDRGTLASAFDYTRFFLRGELRLTTFSSRLLFPPTFNLKLTAGTAIGTLPPQRLFGLESRYDGVGPFGVLRGGGVREFVGDRFAALSLEHNFRSTPFLLLNIPYLYRNGIEVIVHGAIAQTWDSSHMLAGRTTSGWYTEAGAGISRILSFFRLDFTYRFKNPRGVYLSLGVAQII